MTLYRQDDPNVRKCVRHGQSTSSISLPSSSTSTYTSQYYSKKPVVVSKMTKSLATVLQKRRAITMLWGLGFCILFLFVFSLPSTSTGQCECRSESHTDRDGSLLKRTPQGYSETFSNDQHKMAILIPFRDRFEELLEFAPHINNFLKTQRKNHHIYIINQVDNLRFNRASLLNVGFLESSEDCDYIAMHDVDLLPLNRALQYEYPDEGPYHVAAPHLHPRYHYPTFIGGILLVNRDHFRKVDGLSNKYWGWGLEDDEFFARLKEADLSVTRPGNLTSGTKDTFKHIHDRRVRRRDMIKCYNQQEVTRRRDRQTGLSTTRYHVQSRKEMTIEGAPITILNIILDCDRSVTPWCDCTENVGNTQRTHRKSEKAEDVIVPKLDRKKHLSQDA